MSTKTKLKPVLLRHDQVEELHQLQERERNHSGLGIAPSIHEIARSLMTKALSDASNKLVKG